MFLLFNGKNNTLIHNKRDFRSRLKCLLGFRPRNLRLYETAFIHRSASYTYKDGSRINNERLEFLGDAILDNIISEYLFQHYPDASEGFLTKSRARIVNRETLNSLAMSMNLETLMVSNVASVGVSRNLYGNALEALIGAMFTDKGYEYTRHFFIKKVLNRHLNLSEILESETDYKSLIMEYGQKNRYPINFRFSEETDTTSQRQVFSVALEINGEVSATGQGSSKKEAEQDAALKAWIRLKSLS